MMEEQFGWRVSETVRNAIIGYRRFALFEVARQKAFKENRREANLFWKK
jgi:hypothetical protein